MRLLLIRHGQTSSNVEGSLDTALPGAGLTDLGRAQAAALPQALEEYAVSAVYCSPLDRTHETAAPLASALGLPVETLDDLREIAAGTYEMRSDHQARTDYLGAMDAWMAGDLGRRLGEAEDGHGFSARYLGALAEIARRHRADETAVALSHGAAIRVVTALVDPRGGLEVAVARRIANTGASLLEGDPDHGWRLVSWHADPLGGAHLLDAAAVDPTGQDDAVDAPRA